MRRDPISGRTVVIAPGRARRPGAFDRPPDPPTQGELEECPFCAGREDRTPPETLRLPRDGDWRVRVVPNLYPAFQRQEVVVHSPRHERSLADLDDEELRLVARTWRLRREAEPRGYLFAFVNEGREAGASLLHTHSQLVWLEEPPPAVAAERNLERLLDGEVVLETEGVVAVCPPAGRVPYEVLVAPREPQAEVFASELLPQALVAVAEVVRRLRRATGPSPLNVWLHDGPHWHFEVVPRVTTLAALELGAGLYVNPVDPREAAAQLREAAA